MEHHQHAVLGGRAVNPTRDPRGLVPLVAALLLLGCTRANTLMTPTGQVATALKPSPGKSLVVFLRPGRAAGLVHAALYDEDRIVGVSSANTAIAYELEPGAHLFMVVGEAADFLAAEVLAGLTYYVAVSYRAGVWRARFSLQPLNASEYMAQIQEWLDAVQVMSIDSNAREWDAANRASVLDKRRAYLRKWERRSPDDRPALHPSDGVDLGVRIADQTSELPADRATEDRRKANPDAAARLRELENLKEEGLISEEEYFEKRTQILDQL